MKKKLLAFCVAATMALVVNAQEKVKDKDVPAGIQTSFKSQFPAASGAEWKMKDGHYKVHFNSDGEKHVAGFDESGKLVSRGMAIRQADLPQAISSAVSSSHSDRTIEEVYRMEKNGNTLYKVKLSGNPETKLVYSADGQLIKEKDKHDW